MPKLSKEEKIRRLEAQIRALKEGKDTNILYENEYFYIRKNAGLHMKSYGGVINKKCVGLSVPTYGDDEIKKWLSAAEDAVKVYLSMD